MCSREVIAFPKSPNRVLGRAGRPPYLLSQQTEFCCPRAEKLQKPSQVSGQVMP